MMIFRPKGLLRQLRFLDVPRAWKKDSNFVFRPELRSRKEEQNDEQN